MNHFARITLKTILFISIIAFQGCKKDPCSNVVCLNGGFCANGDCNCPLGYEGSDCSIEKMPTSVRINSIRLVRYPMTTTSGAGWDGLAGNGPDVFLTINSGTVSNLNDFISGRVDNVVGQSLYYTTNLPITLPSPTTNWSVGLWDEDSFSNEFMGGIYFVPSNFKAGFPPTITLTTSAISIELNVTWLF